MARKDKRRPTPKRRTRVATKKQEFPQIFRIISRVIVMIICIVIIAFSSLSSNKNTQNNRMKEAKQAILQDPFTPWGYEQMGEYFYGNNDFPHAKEAYRMAMMWGSRTAIQEYQKVVEKESSPRVINEAIGEWLQFLQNHPDYRDGWVALGLLSYQIGDKKTLKNALQQARVINSTTDAQIAALQSLVDKK